MSSFSVLNDVDEQTSKAVLGSDGASRWQDFIKKDNKIKVRASVAPAIPLKRLDRALGTKSIADERAAESKIRKDAGERELGSGYTEFKRKTDHEEIAAQKKRKLILERVRPDDMAYFIPAETFEGSKFDYVFTTKSRGTGYYWDGWDSMKRELGGEKTDAKEDVTQDNSGATGDKLNHSKVKKKQKKRKMHEPIEENDQRNPMEEVAQALRRKQAALSRSGASSPAQSHEVSASDAIALGVCPHQLESETTPNTTELEKLPSGWESAIDPSSGKVYYFSRTTSVRTWEKPVLPSGWGSTKDPNSLKTYYYHSDGRTSWTKPTE